MSAQKGYYSLIQYCPDASRLEAVNVGLVLFCPTLDFIAARTTKGNQRAEKLVGRAGLDRPNLDAAKRAIKERFDSARSSFVTLDDLQKFVDTRANILKLTAPRPVKVFNPAEDLERLFQELVGGQPATSRRSEKNPVVLRLDAFFRQLAEERRAQLDLHVPVPVIGQSIHIPYAYRNGVLNLVKPHRFGSQEKQTIKTAMRLAMEGDLLSGRGAAEPEQQRLVVVASFDATERVRALESRVKDVFEFYNVRAVSDTDIEAFVSEVEQEAHS